MPSPVHPYSDYGVALRTLKFARSWLSTALLLCVIAQFIGFAIMWWTPQPYEHMKSQYRHAAHTEAATVPAPPESLEEFFPGSQQGHELNIRKQWEMAYTMAVPATQFASIVAVSSQAIIVFVTLLIVLIAQAPGVAQMTRSLIWSVLLMFMFLPWQLSTPLFPIPGVGYGYAEILRYIGPVLGGAEVHGYQILLIYVRFLVWPLIGLFVLLITSERYRAGVMIAIGHPLQSILQPRGTRSLTAPGGFPLAAGKKSV